MGRITVGLKEFNNIIEKAENKGMTYEIYEGSLLDNAIVYFAKGMELEGVGDHEYIIIREVYLNSWSSELEVFGTDDIIEVGKYEDDFERDS